MTAAEGRLAAARQCLVDGEPRGLLAALGVTPDQPTAALWGPLLTKLLGGPDELAAIRWSVQIGHRMVEGTPTLAEYTGDLKERLDAAHRFLREVADGPSTTDDAVAPHPFETVEGTYAHRNDCRHCPHPAAHPVHTAPDGWQDIALTVTVRAYDDANPAAVRDGLAELLSGVAAEDIITESDAFVRRVELVSPTAEPEPVPPAPSGREDVLDCLSCGATIEECDQVCRDTGLVRSCCGTCKVTATHTVAAHRARGTAGHRG